MEPVTIESKLIAAWTEAATQLADPSRLSPSELFPGCKGTAAYLCYWVPPEVFRAGGYHPFLLRGFNSPTAGSDCGQRTAILNAFKNGAPAPGLSFIAAPNTCKALEVTVRQIAASHDLAFFTFEDPRCRNDECLRHYMLEMVMLRDMVADKTPLSEYDARLVEAMALYGRTREELADLRNSGKLPGDLQFLLLAATQTAPPETVLPLLAEIRSSLYLLPAVAGKPLLVIGGLAGLAEWTLARELAEAGGQIAADLLCTSGRRIDEHDHTDDISRIEALAVEYFNRLPCLPVEPNGRFYHAVENIIGDHGIRGVIFLQPGNCAAYTAEEERLRWHINMPVLTVGRKLLEMAPERRIATFSRFIAGLD